MKVREYIQQYTLGTRIPFKDVWNEIKEFFAELFKFNISGINEEFQDVMHFMQLYFFWKFGLNGELWKIASGSTNKFMKRKEVWKKMYLLCGLRKDISNYVGNYNRPEKVIKHLSIFGVPAARAEEVYKKIVLKMTCLDIGIK